MQHTVPYMIGELIGLWWYVALFAFVTLGVGWPLMLFSMMRSMKGIRRELSTLNETLQNKLIIR